MSVFTSHPAARWAVPAVTVAAIAAGTTLLTRPASADAGLPPITAQQLLVDVQQSTVEALSGTVSQSVDLGLPQVPGMTSGGSGGSGATLDSVASGTHTWRVWVGGPTRQRLALMGDLGESDLVRNGSDLWLWSSSDRSAVHTTLPADAPAGARLSAHPMPTDLPRTPTEAAQMALRAVDPTTVVTTTGTDDVAGRPAYTLVLDPRDPATRVAQVRISVDSATKVPLRVQVFSTKLANPAVDVGFTQVDFGTPAASTFAFTPPPGTTVTQKSLPDSAAGSSDRSRRRHRRQRPHRRSSARAGPRSSSRSSPRAPSRERRRAAPPRPDLTSAPCSRRCRRSRAPGAAVTSSTARSSRPCSPTTAGWPWAPSLPTACMPRCRPPDVAVTPA